MNRSNIVWTPELVKEWLEVTVKVERAQPPVGPRMARPRMIIIRGWLELLWDELDEDERKREQRFRPTGEQVSMWEEVILRWYPLVDSGKNKKILWLRSGGMGMRRIGKVVGLSRQTTTHRYNSALANLVWQLNHPKKT